MFYARQCTSLLIIKFNSATTVAVNYPTQPLFSCDLYLAKYDY